MRFRLVHFLILASCLFVSVCGHADRVEKRSRDLILPNQIVPVKQSIVNPALGAAGAILDDHAGNTSAAAVSVTSGITQPDVPRAVSITSGGTTNDVAACTITVSGTSIRNDSISEDFTFTANEAATKTGTKAFKTITQVAFPASCEDSPFGATWDVNTTDKLGLKHCLAAAGHLIMSVFDGAYEATRATVAADADEVEKNTADINGTLDGAKDLDLFYFQNYRCLRRR